MIYIHVQSGATVSSSSLGAYSCRPGGDSRWHGLNLPHLQIAIMERSMNIAVTCQSYHLYALIHSLRESTQKCINFVEAFVD